MPTILTEAQEFDVAATRPSPGLWIGAADLERVTGFTLKPEGLCKDAICVPLPRGEESFVDATGAVDAAAFWRHIGNPVVQDDAGEVWSFGIGAGERAQAFDTLEAPDFTLSDFDGRPHALSELRGKKVFLATWASW